MSKLPCPYCGFNCEIPSDTEEKIECPGCGSIFLYIQQSKSHGEIDYRPSPEINDRSRQMSKLKEFDVGLGQYCEDGSPCVVAFDADRNPRLLNEKVYLKAEADKVISELEESHKKEVEQLLMKIAGLEKLVETADKLLKPKGGFTIKDVTFKGIKLEG